MVGLERALQGYCASGAHEQPFDLRIVPVSSQAITVLDEKEKPAVAEAPVHKKDDRNKAGRLEIYARTFPGRGESMLD